jgi:hypothetical protein
MTSIALSSVAKRAAKYAIIQRKNQLSKLCKYGTETPGTVDLVPTMKDPNYIIA